MPIKNYTTKVPANQSIREIQESLVAHGAIGFAMEYEKGTGRISFMRFVLELKNQQIPFRLPVDWRRFQTVLASQRVMRASDEDYCYRVAWRVLADWVKAQMALYETEMVTIPQIFLPYAIVTKGGQTLFEHVLANPVILLGSGQGGGEQ